MKKIIYFSLVAFLIVLGCTKEDDLGVNPGENELKSARTATVFGVFENNPDVLKTALFTLPVWGMDRFKNEYSFLQIPLLPKVSGFPDSYDFSPYYINGETDYNPANYDVMTHFEYNSPEAVTGAVVEFTFPQIQYFVPHFTGVKQIRTYSVNNSDNQTVITCTTNLVKGWNPMFCFIVKVDCGKGKSGLANVWTDMKVNGVSVKGTIPNKVFDCN